MNSKSKFLLILSILVCIVLLGMAVKSFQDEQAKSLDYIMLQTDKNVLIWKYNNNSIQNTDNPLNLSSPVITIDKIISNLSNLYEIKNDRELVKVKTMPGTIFSYQDDANYIIGTSERYLRVSTDNDISDYYLFDSQYNFINCRQIVKYQVKILCLSSNLGSVFELKKSDTAIKFTDFEKSGYIIVGLYNVKNNLLVIYQDFSVSNSDNKDLSTIVLKVNNKEIDLPSNFVYQVIYKNNNYILSTISESNIKSKQNNFEIYKLTPEGSLEKLYGNIGGVLIF